MPAGVLWTAFICVSIPVVVPSPLKGDVVTLLQSTRSVDSSPAARSRTEIEEALTKRQRQSQEESDQQRWLHEEQSNAMLRAANAHAESEEQRRLHEARTSAGSSQDEHSSTDSAAFEPEDDAASTALVEKMLAGAEEVSDADVVSHEVDVFEPSPAVVPAFTGAAVSEDDEVARLLAEADSVGALSQAVQQAPALATDVDIATTSASATAPTQMWQQSPSQALVTHDQVSDDHFEERDAAAPLDETVELAKQMPDQVNNVIAPLDENMESTKEEPDQVQESQTTLEAIQKRNGVEKEQAGHGGLAPVAGAPAPAPEPEEVTFPQPVQLPEDDVDPISKAKTMIKDIAYVVADETVARERAMKEVLFKLGKAKSEDAEQENAAAAMIRAKVEASTIPRSTVDVSAPRVAPVAGGMGEADALVKALARMEQDQKILRGTG